MDYAKEQVKKNNSWTDEYVNQIEKEFERFIFLKSIDNECSPSDDIDILWHQILLDTEYYYNYCKKNFNQIIHHKPQNSLDQEARKLRLEKTAKLYKEIYNEEQNPIVWQKFNTNNNSTNILGNSELLNEINNIKQEVSNDLKRYMIFIKPYSGTFALYVTKNDTIDYIKSEISKKIDMNKDIMRLVYSNITLENNYTLSYYNIYEHATLHALVKVKGC